MYIAYCSGSPHDSMVVLKQKSLYTEENDRSFFHVMNYILISILIPSSYLYG